MYNTETTEKCKELIISKTIDINILYASNMTLFDAFVRTIRTIYIWCALASIGYTKIFSTFKTFILTIVISVGIYLIGMLLMSWVKFNFKQSHDNIRINLVRELIENCKAIQDMDCPDWQRKKIMNDIASVGDVSITWDNNK